ncbi:hypothetical protein BT67DRAFT_83422 [Trichocladium antarcticum]|uniref:Uncharacterized protein n=1 Tax=Trichocladium antarcticum TaxID=1450529 RepID=A0AAN6UGJ2_9PEZI|nr:hypothetical protein BT67DRAFT_83422 [Trichocladium antarcticum]
MDAFDTAKPDRFQQSLGSAWASFLSSQHCSREVGALRRTLDDHIHQANVSIASLQQDSSQRHDLVTAAVAESQSKIEQTATSLAEIGSLRDRISTLQREVGQDREHALRRFAELSDKLGAQQNGLEGVRSIVSQTSPDSRNVEEQYRVALEKVELLQGELKELRAEKVASERRLAALEHRIATIPQPRQELPEEAVRVLGQILSRQDGLVRLLDNQDGDVPTQSPTQHMLHASMLEPRAPTPVRTGSHRNRIEDTRPSTAAKMRTEHAPQTNAEPAMPPHGQDIRSLYLIFRDRYKASPPKSDVGFIWEFIEGIESPDMSIHVQESLVAILPDYVTRSRDTRRKKAQRRINISKGLTWRKFREALVKIPTPS